MEQPVGKKFRALNHKDSKVSEVYYKVLMTRVLHTARISNFVSVMFVESLWLSGRASE